MLSIRAVRPVDTERPAATAGAVRHRVTNVRRRRTAGVTLLAALLLTACGAAPQSAGPQPTVGAAPSVTSGPTPSAQDPATESTEGTVVRFVSSATTVEVTVDEDSPAVRSFLGMLPLTLTVEEFSGREKIAYLPNRLAYAGSPGSDPEDGDLIYFVPWGNLGFYYNTEGVGYSDQTIHLGTYRATLEQLEQLESGDVTVEIA